MERDLEEGEEEERDALGQTHVGSCVKFPSLEY